MTPFPCLYCHAPKEAQTLHSMGFNMGSPKIGLLMRCVVCEGIWRTDAYITKWEGQVVVQQPTSEEIMTAMELVRAAMQEE